MEVFINDIIWPWNILFFQSREDALTFAEGILPICPEFVRREFQLSYVPLRLTKAACGASNNMDQMVTETACGASNNVDQIVTETACGAANNVDQIVTDTACGVEHGGDENLDADLQNLLLDGSNLCSKVRLCLETFVNCCREFETQVARSRLYNQRVALFVTMCDEAEGGMVNQQIVNTFVSLLDAWEPGIVVQADHYRYIKTFFGKIMRSFSHGLPMIWISCGISTLSEMKMHIVQTVDEN